MYSIGRRHGSVSQSVTTHEQSCAPLQTRQDDKGVPSTKTEVECQLPLWRRMGGGDTMRSPSKFSNPPHTSAHLSNVSRRPVLGVHHSCRNGPRKAGGVKLYRCRRTGSRRHQCSAAADSVNTYGEHLQTPRVGQFSRCLSRYGDVYSCAEFRPAFTNRVSRILASLCIREASVVAAHLAMCMEE